MNSELGTWNLELGTAIKGDEMHALLYDPPEPTRMALAIPEKHIFHSIRLGRTVVKTLAMGYANGEMSKAGMENFKKHHRKQKPWQEEPVGDKRKNVEQESSMNSKKQKVANE